MKKQELILAWTRDFTLPWAQWWSRDMNPRLVEVIGKGVPHQLSYFNGKLLETYRIKKEAVEFIDAVVNAHDKNKVLETKKLKRYILLIDQIMALIPKGKKITDRKIFEKIKDKTREMYPWYTISYLLPQEQWSKKLIEKYPKQSAKILARLIYARKKSEGTVEYLIEYWREVARALLKVRNISSKFISFVTYEEIEKMLYDSEFKPDIKELKSRAKGYVFYVDKVYTGISLNRFLQKYKFAFTPIAFNLQTEEISGQVSCLGKKLIKGRVSIILTNEDVDNFKNGDILVSVMTNPYFVPIMKKAKAIVTDEGGITCHAAIVSRELNIPCIIGTKIATKVFKDGDIVEVDANKGIIRKI
jgi:phosphoenolpyruvate synthase/pyruvate phosphate dikinase